MADSPTLTVLGPGLLEPGVSVTAAAGAEVAHATEPAVLDRLSAVRTLLAALGVTDISSLAP
jgi:hypothetical protein